jgi:hypothetical protein
VRPPRIELGLRVPEIPLKKKILLILLLSNPALDVL